MHAIDTNIHVPVNSWKRTAIEILQYKPSRKFHSCIFHHLQYRADIFTPAFSSPAILTWLHFPASLFQRSRNGFIRVNKDEMTPLSAYCQK